MAHIIENNGGGTVSGMAGSRDSGDVTKTLAVLSLSLSGFQLCSLPCIGLNLREIFLHRVRKTALPSLRPHSF